MNGAKSSRSINATSLYNEGKQQEAYRDMVLNGKLRNASILTTASKAGSI